MKISKWLMEIRIKKLKREGLVVGNNFQIERNSFLDSSFPWLIKIGNNVTIAPDVLVLAHDGSTQKLVGYSKVGRVVIGDNVFVGAKSVVLPNTTIGDNCIIAAGCIVGGDIPANSVVCGVPGRVVQTVDEFRIKNCDRCERGKKFDESFTKKGKISLKKKKQMIEILENEKNGFVI